MPQPTAPDSIILSKWTGLKNTVTPERLTASELHRAINIDLDDDGQAHRRRGFTQKVSGASYHSLYEANDGTVYGVRNGALGIVRPDFSFTSLGRTVGGDPTIGAAPVAYTQVGKQIYYSCASDAGIITGSSVSDWGNGQDIFLSPVVNPTATLPAIRGRLLGKPPLATQLTYSNGRIYLAQANLVWATELYLYNFVDKTRGFYNFEADVTMLGSVSDGLYVGTKEGLWFLSGTHAEGLKRVRVMDSPVIPGSAVPVPAELANPPQVGTQAVTQLQISICFMTTTGFCVAKDGGEVENLTESKFFFPTAVRSAALFRRQDGMNQYIAVNDSGGTPVNNARIGDYVEADIIRFNGAWLDMSAAVKMADFLSASVVHPTIGSFGQAAGSASVSGSPDTAGLVGHANGSASVAGQSSGSFANADGSSSVVGIAPGLAGHADGSASASGVGLTIITASGSADGSSSGIAQNAFLTGTANGTSSASAGTITAVQGAGRADGVGT